MELWAVKGTALTPALGAACASCGGTCQWVGGEGVPLAAQQPPGKLQAWGCTGRSLQW